MTDSLTEAIAERQQRTRHVALAVLAGSATVLGLWAVVLPGQGPLPWAMAPLHSRCVGAMQLGLALALWRAWRSRDAALAHAPMRALAASCAGSAVALVMAMGGMEGAVVGAPGAAERWTPWVSGFIAVAALAEGLTRAAHELQAPAEHPHRGWLAVAVLAAALALVLLLAPAQLAPHWPWRMAAGLAGGYVGPFAALSVLALAVARERRRYVRHALLLALLATAAGVLAASAWHLTSFSLARPSGYVWFLAFAGLFALALQGLRVIHPRQH